MCQFISGPLALASVLVDYEGWRNGDISGAKFGVNTGFTALGFVPPAGPYVAGGYFLIDNTYPGGADGFVQDLPTTVVDGLGDAIFGPQDSEP